MREEARAAEEAEVTEPSQILTSAAAAGLEEAESEDEKADGPVAAARAAAASDDLEGWGDVEDEAEEKDRPKRPGAKSGEPEGKSE